MMYEKARFFGEFLRHPVQMGAVAPSSSSLARAIVREIDWGLVTNTMEAGPGTGSITRVLKRHAPPSGFFAVEISPALSDQLRTAHPEIDIYTDSVEAAPRICRERGIGHVDAVVSGLPWAGFPRDLQDRCLGALLEVLAPGGQFATYGYLQGLILPAGRRFRRLLESRFSAVRLSPVVWRNLPPAIVYHCVR